MGIRSRIDRFGDSCWLHDKPVAAVCSLEFAAVYSLDGLKTLVFGFDAEEFLICEGLVGTDPPAVRILS